MAVRGCSHPTPTSQASLRFPQQSQSRARTDKQGMATVTLATRPGYRQPAPTLTQSPSSLTPAWAYPSFPTC